MERANPPSRIALWRDMGNRTLVNIQSVFPRYEPAILKMIRECILFKLEHELDGDLLCGAASLFTGTLLP